MTPRSPSGIEQRRKRYHERMAGATTPIEVLSVEYDDLRSLARRVDPSLLDELLRATILEIRAARTRIRELHTTGRSA